MSEFSWSDPQFAAAGEFIEWAEGVELVGDVVDLQTHHFPESERGPARTVPKVLVVDDKGHVTEVTCGKADLKKKMVAAAPGIGDRIKIECIGSTKTQVGVQLFFKVTVRRSGNTQAINGGGTLAAVPAAIAAEKNAAAQAALPEEAPF